MYLYVLNFFLFSDKFHSYVSLKLGFSLIFSRHYHHPYRCRQFAVSFRSHLKIEMKKKINMLNDIMYIIARFIDCPLNYLVYLSQLPSSKCFRLLCEMTTPPDLLIRSSSTNVVKNALDESFVFCNAFNNVCTSFSSVDTSSVNVFTLLPFCETLNSSFANVRLITHRFYSFLLQMIFVSIYFSLTQFVNQFDLINAKIKREKMTNQKLNERFQYSVECQIILTNASAHIESIFVGMCIVFINRCEFVFSSYHLSSASTIQNSGSDKKKQIMSSNSVTADDQPVESIKKFKFYTKDDKDEIEILIPEVR